MKKTFGRIFNFRPALFAAAFFALGILFAYGVKYKEISPFWLFMGVPLLGTSLLFSSEREKTLFTAAALTLVFSLGTVLFTAETAGFSRCGEYFGTHTVIATVSDKKQYENFSVVRFTRLTIDGKREKGTLVATLYGSFADKAELSDEVVFTGKVETYTKEFDDYGFRSGDIADKVRFRARINSLSATGRSGNVFLSLRLRLYKALHAGMGEDEGAAAYALLTGDTSGIERGLLENIRFGGIAHIFAVSGLHIGALYAFCLLLLQKTRLKTLPKPLRFLFVALPLLFYGGICGYSSSVVRALTTCLVFYAFRLIGVKSDFLENTGAAALVVLVLHPVLLFEVGFLLSFSACLSIGILSRTIGDALGGGKKRKDLEAPESLAVKFENSVRSFLSVSLAAQIGTLPVLLSFFGYASGWSLLLNFLFVPIVSGAFSFLLLFSFVAALLPLSAAPVLLYLPSTLWSAVLLLFHGADFSSFALRFGGFGGATAFFYAFFLILSDKIRLSRFVRLILLTVSAVCFTVGAFFF